MRKIRSLAHNILRKIGYDVQRYAPPAFGRDAYDDMQFFLQGHSSPVIFDVGANVGQSVHGFKRTFPHAVIHSFEPSPQTFEKLNEVASMFDNVHAWNYGLGSMPSELPLRENRYTDMSSFLESGRTCWGTIEKVTTTPVITLDEFTKEQQTGVIDILKSDTQGYEFEVFKGASRLMDENKIGIIYFEHIFSDMYKGIAPFNEIFHYLLKNNFALVGIYDQHFQNNLVSWADVMFINNDYKRRLVDTNQN